MGAEMVRHQDQGQPRTGAAPQVVLSPWSPCRHVSKIYSPSPNGNRWPSCQLRNIGNSSTLIFLHLLFYTFRQNPAFFGNLQKLVITDFPSENTPRNNLRHRETSRIRLLRPACLPIPPPERAKEGPWILSTRGGARVLFGHRQVTRGAFRSCFLTTDYANEPGSKALLQEDAEETEF